MMMVKMMTVNTEVLMKEMRSDGNDIFMHKGENYKFESGRANLGSKC
jgi:hypothetical protein